jgi:BirA family transcriptional regulator, biotin operon repressor / biotin---[acetyl-CoA-carboxylase] ligase
VNGFFHMERHASLGSSNDEAFRRAGEGAPEGLVVTAEAQTAGRGRRGRAWTDAPGKSLLFSVLLAPAIPPPSYPLLSLALAASVAEAGRTLAGAAFEVKWPNDVTHRGLKVCGILAESRASGPGNGRAPTLVIGAGVNVNQRDKDFPPELRGRAGSLRMAAGGRTIDREALLTEILRRFEPSVALARGGDSAPLFAALERHLPPPGRLVAVRVGDRVVEGPVEAVLETGALRVRDTRSGLVETVAAGELT